MKKSKILLIILIFVLILIISTCLGYFFYVKSGATDLRITLSGEADITLNLNDEYLEPGVVATYGKKDISSCITTSNNIDTSKIGTYSITYSVKHRYKSTSITRTINVVDTTLPKIILSGDSEISIFVNGTFTEPGYSAIDNYDGDITSNVVVNNPIDVKKAGDYTINYSVTDSSGNTAQIQRIIKVKNKTYSGVGIPVLMYHFFYDASAGETGADANYMEIGNFEAQVKYLVENDYYFPTWEEFTSYINGSTSLPQKSIVITVDDCSDSFLRLAVPVLRKYNVHATSFVITSWYGSYDSLNQYRDILYFESHSHDMHKGGTDGKGRILTLAHDSALADLKQSQQICGSSLVFCYPFGHYNESSKALLQEAGFKVAFTTGYGKVRFGMDPYQLPRIRMSKGDSLNSFINKIK